MSAKHPQTGPEGAAWLQERLQLAPPKRILVPTREHIGDVVNTTGLLLSLRRLYPDATIVVDTGERAASVLDGFPGIDEVWSRPTHQGGRGKLAYIRRLRRDRFDLAVIFDDSNDHALHTWLGGVKTRVGFWRGVKFENRFSAYVPFRFDRHEIRDHGAELLRMLGQQDPDATPKLFPTPAQRVEANRLFESTCGERRPVVGIHPGASEPKRRWEPARWAKVNDLLTEQGVTVLFIGGTAEAEALDEIEHTAKKPILRLPLCPDLLTVGCVMSRLDLMLCGDTGPMHLAAALGTRVVALYGPAIPVHTCPAGQGHRILQADCDCPARSPKYCTQECLRRITPEQVAEAALEALKTAPKR